ncbi:MAG TPA: hypothetical protein VFR85_19305 [Anaeromyxobacteraceae bacterium]|nr:hypothetical protein [Anaeromyxobacteraceae bacterium]
MAQANVTWDAPRILFGFFVLAHDRRRVVHFNVTAHPTAEWTAWQLVQAFPEKTVPRFVLRDRDTVYGERFRQAIEGLGVEEVDKSCLSATSFRPRDSRGIAGPFPWGRAVRRSP